MLDIPEQVDACDTYEVAEEIYYDEPVQRGVHMIRDRFHAHICGTLAKTLLEAHTDGIAGNVFE